MAATFDWANDAVASIIRDETVLVYDGQTLFAVGPASNCGTARVTRLQWCNRPDSAAPTAPFVIPVLGVGAPATVDVAEPATRVKSRRRIQL